MANGSYDIVATTTPQLGNLKPSIHEGRTTIAALRTSLQTQAPDYYTDDRLNKMTRNDLVYADRVDTLALPVIDSAEPANGTDATPYSHQYTVSSGSLPITWSVTDGALPDGLTLTEAGLLAGTPTVVDDFTFTVTATNAAGTDDQETTVTIGA